MKIRKLLVVWLVVLPGLVMASGGGTHLDRAHVDIGDQASLQRGAQLFVNYCLSCHSAAFMRYNRMGKDLGLSDELVANNLMFATEKPGDLMTVAMRGKDAKHWFGTAIPDLSLVSRSRGVDWLYTYLRTFYVDDSRPFGVNNLVFEDVGMPHVLADLQGMQKAVFHTVKDAYGTEHEVIDHLEVVSPGLMTPDEYDRAVRDLVNFLAYTGEPAKMERERLGGKVLLFLVVFFVVALMLKKEYWKDIH